MKTTDDRNIHEEPMIQLEKHDNAAPLQEEGEVPVITIEEDENATGEWLAPRGKKPGQLKKWTRHALTILGIALLVILGLEGLNLYNYYYNIGVSISVSPKENIAKLQGMKAQGGASSVTLRKDSILGVALNIFEPHHVKAEMTLTEPDTADHSVLMYVATADYTVTGKYLGSLVIDGEEKQSDVSRLGYCAVWQGNMVIGISRSDAVKSFIVDHDGSYFRQFVLLSDGEMPRRFFLHGKVERKALARTIDDRLCIVETRHPETLWDFADALREYGFVDAIYLTGGNESGFYRAPDGTAIFTEKAAHYRTDKHHGVRPWLVLRKR